MGNALLDWAIKVFALLGVAGTAGFFVKWGHTFFTKQRELSAIDADARKALQEAGAGWQSTAEAQKALRAAEAEQSARTIADLEKHRADLAKALSRAHTTIERERAIVDWALRFQHDSLLQIISEAQTEAGAHLGAALRDLKVAGLAPERAIAAAESPLIQLVVVPAHIRGAARGMHHAATAAIRVSRDNPGASVSELLKVADAAIGELLEDHPDGKHQTS